MTASKRFIPASWWIASGRATCFLFLRVTTRPTHRTNERPGSPDLARGTLRPSPAPQRGAGQGHAAIIRGSGETPEGAGGAAGVAIRRPRGRRRAGRAAAALLIPKCRAVAHRRAQGLELVETAR